MKPRLHVPLAAALFAGVAGAQSFNLDVGDALSAVGVPSSAYAAAGMAGPWNSVDGSNGTIVNNLVDVTGAVTSVAVTHNGGNANFFTNNAGTLGDDEKLMDDLQDVGAPPNISTMDFSGLANGFYRVRAYAWAPDNRSGFTTTVTVTGGSTGAQLLGGAWTGSHVLGVTYAEDTVSVTTGTLQIQFAATVGFGSLNGVQLEPGGTQTTSFCTAKTGLTCGVPQISASGTSSAAASSGFAVSAGPARQNKSGILLYNSQPNVTGVPFEGGTLCVQSMGLRRAGSTNSGAGCSPASCNGVFSIDMNAFAMSAWVVPDCNGAPSGIAPNNPAGFLVNPGTQVNCQFWGRDTPGSSFVSDGLSYTVGP